MGGRVFSTDILWRRQSDIVYTLNWLCLVSPTPPPLFPCCVPVKGGSRLRNIYSLSKTCLPANLDYVYGVTCFLLYWLGYCTNPVPTLFQVRVAHALEIEFKEVSLWSCNSGGDTCFIPKHGSVWVSPSLHVYNPVLTLFQIRVARALEMEFKEDLPVFVQLWRKRSDMVYTLDWQLLVERGRQAGRPVVRTWRAEQGKSPPIYMCFTLDLPGGNFIQSYTKTFLRLNRQHLPGRELLSTSQCTFSGQTFQAGTPLILRVTKKQNFSRLNRLVLYTAPSRQWTPLLLYKVLLQNKSYNNAQRFSCLTCMFCNLGK